MTRATMEEAQRELLRLTARIEEITAHLARYHYGPENMVGKNLLAELEGLERDAFDLEQRLIEARATGLLLWTPDYIYATRQRERGRV
jgi:hypothetical protein